LAALIPTEWQSHKFPARVNFATRRAGRRFYIVARCETNYSQLTGQMNNSRPIAILGAGNMGTALAQVIARNEPRVVLWDHFPEVVAEINQARHNSRFLPGIALAANLTAVTTRTECVRDARVVVLAMPSPFIAAAVAEVLPVCAPDAVFVSVAKGIDPTTRELIQHRLAAQLGTRPLVLLAGPAIANEFARGLPAAIVLAAPTLAGAEAVRPVLEGDIFRVTTTDDVTGAALGGVLKNVYAILLGYVAAAAGESRNLEAAVLNTSLREMADLAQALGAKPETIYGLAGLGDLVATGFSEDSHNRGFGYKLGLGRTLAELQREVPLWPEGTRTVEIACAWADARGIRVPLAEFVRQAVTGTQPPVQELLRHL
jgi:glycerol-3-phosphate dehydrogenase (NAD(P)+)